MSLEPASRHTALTAELADDARTLADNDLNRTHVTDAPALLHDLHASIDALKQATAQMSWRHSRAIKGSDYAVEDAAAQLLAASRFLAAASDATAAAEKASKTVRWRRRNQQRSTSTEQ
jgi:hypothetical protein